MKNTKLILIICLLTFFSCKNDKKVNYVLFSGKIENSIIDSFPIIDINNNTVHTIHLNKDNSFNDTLFIPKGYYYFDDRHNIISLFLTPSFNLNANISYKEVLPKFVFEGVGANENNYLQQKKRFDKKFKKVTNYKYFLGLSETSFLELANSINIAKMNFLKSHSNLHKNFMFYESFEIENENTTLLNQYRKWRGKFLKNKDFKVSENYPNPFKKINVSNEKLLEQPYYLQCLKQFIYYKTENNTSEDKTLFYLKTIDKEIENQNVKNELAFEMVNFGITQTKKLDAVYNKFNSIEKNEVYKNKIQETYQNLKKNSKGLTSPTFALKDINNNHITLESLKGKIVYIDIWATWCVPCVNEIPALKQLQYDFRNKDIQFVSICIKDSKVRFENMVKEKKLSGLQLFAPDENISFFKDYFLNGIPRFILIDKEGKIIDANAYKPSNPKLKEIILEELN